ncbi:hypothetical protein ACQP2E_18860 [Actinoplanes sp. CA-015351]|uniref:hypothetical protein n=1 Tax=Actinoplanes sp. CA-015351 TaxID=3239897 RepID=UPI003D979C17
MIRRGAGVAWLVMLASFVLALFAGSRTVLIVAVIVLLDVAAQTAGILNQARVFAVAHEARSRANTAFVVCNFLGGAAGSAAATLLWQAGGWRAVSVAGMLLSVFALAVWAYGARSVASWPPHGRD